MRQPVARLAPSTSPTDEPRTSAHGSRSPATSLTLEPGRARTVPFTVRVPADAKPGQWVGGIVAETSRQVSGREVEAEGERPDQDPRPDDRCRAGERPRADRWSGSRSAAVKTGGQRGFQEVVTHIANTGNASSSRRAPSRCSTSRARSLEVLTFKMDTFLPQTAVDYPMLLKKALRPGDYRAKVQLVLRVPPAPREGRSPRSRRSRSPSRT